MGIAACDEKPVPAKTVVAIDPRQITPSSDNTMTERFSHLMEFYKENELFSGTILVTQDGNTIYKDAFGWANLEWGIPNTKNENHVLSRPIQCYCPIPAWVVEPILDKERYRFRSPNLPPHGVGENVASEKLVCIDKQEGPGSSSGHLL